MIRDSLSLIVAYPLWKIQIQMKIQMKHKYCRLKHSFWETVIGVVKLILNVLYVFLLLFIQLLQRNSLTNSSNVRIMLLPLAESRIHTYLFSQPCVHPPMPTHWSLHFRTAYNTHNSTPMLQISVPTDIFFKKCIEMRDLYFILFYLFIYLLP